MNECDGRVMNRNKFKTFSLTSYFYYKHGQLDSITHKQIDSITHRQIDSITHRQIDSMTHEQIDSITNGQYDIFTIVGSAVRSINHDINWSGQIYGIFLTQGLPG